MQAVRLDKKEIETIVKLFSDLFIKGDRIWLFGSRTQLNQKGGDIDLYIETQMDKLDTITKKKRRFLSDLKSEIGDQKIDLVINFPGNTELAIHKHAKLTGVLLHEKD